MIIDVLANAPRYLALNPGFPKAMEFLRRPDLKDLPLATYAIDGDRVYAMVAREPGRRPKGKDVHLETHNRYIDIQLVLAGTDMMGWKARSSCQQPTGEYDREADIQFFAEAPELWLPVQPGLFVIFFPEDAHLPLISKGELHKVVVKIAVDHE